MPLMRNSCSLQILHYCRNFIPFMALSCKRSITLTQHQAHQFLLDSFSRTFCNKFSLIQNKLFVTSIYEKNIRLGRFSHLILPAYHHHVKVSQYKTFDSQPPSWLFVSNAIAGAYGAQVNLDLDLDAKISAGSVTSLQQNIADRGMDFDVEKLVSTELFVLFFQKICLFYVIV